MKKILICVLLHTIILKTGIAQRTAAVFFASTNTFKDFSGNTVQSGADRSWFVFADNHLQVKIISSVISERLTFRKFQKGKLNHHDRFFDFDSSADYSFGNYDVKHPVLVKRRMNDSAWIITDTSLFLLGYKVKIATRFDNLGRKHSVLFTEDLDSFKVRLQHFNVPGFVLNYEIATTQALGVHTVHYTAKKITFFEEAILFPNNYKIIAAN